MHVLKVNIGIKRNAKDAEQMRKTRIVRTNVHGSSDTWTRGVREFTDYCIKYASV